MSKMVLTKFEVAERQLLQAIHMYFKNEDEISIHTLSESASQVLRDIGKKFEAVSLLRDSNLIRKDKKKEWFKIINQSKNFFKHADNDAESTHEFDPIINDFSLFDGVSLYQQIKKKHAPETIVFQTWFNIKYPDLLKENSDYKKRLTMSIEKWLIFEEIDKNKMLMVINDIRKNQIEGLSYNYGL